MLDYGLSRGQLEEGWVDMLAWASRSHPLSFPPRIYGITPLILLQTFPFHLRGRLLKQVTTLTSPSLLRFFAQLMLTISAVTLSSYCLLDGKSTNGGQGQLIPRSISCSRKEIIANLQSDRCISILIGVIWPKHLLPLCHSCYPQNSILLLSHLYSNISFTYIS